MQLPEIKCIEESYCLELEVKDSFQIPAIYKIFKDTVDIELNQGDFIKKYNNEEYKEFIEKIKTMEIDKWERNYFSEEKNPEEKVTWKLVICYGDGKKVIKKGEDAYPLSFEDLESYLISITEEY